MDLGINRLKLLNEKELKELDEQIQTYKETKNPLLITTLDELQRTVSDTKRFLNTITWETSEKESQIEQAKKDIDKNNNEYKLLCSHITELESEIDELERETDTIQSKIDESNSNVDKLTKVKDGLQIKLESITENFKVVELRNNEMLDKIRQEIYEYTCRIKHSKQTHFEMYNNFVEDMNVCVAIDTNISEYERIFNSKKEYFMSILCRNMDNYARTRERIKYIIADQQNNYLIHDKLCSGNRQYGECGKCNFIHFVSCSNGGGLYKYSTNHHCVSYNHTKLDEVTRITGKWLKEICYPKMKDYITDPELSYLTQKIHYDELFNLFTTSKLFDEQLNTFSVFEFLCFISFIGSDGNCSLLDLTKS
tara:strand:- start:152 stop:1249 length:1098 start_codon:yes stop_codon:yes gene_type:complete